MNSIQCRILVFLVLLTSCFSPVCGKDKKPRQAIEKLSIDGPYLLKADDGSMRAISGDVQKPGCFHFSASSRGKL